jgi:hypothetical protein
MRLAEAAAEATGGGRVADAKATQSIKVDLVAAPQFDVLEPFATAGPVAPSLDHSETR